MRSLPRAAAALVITAATLLVVGACRNFAGYAQGSSGQEAGPRDAALDAPPTPGDATASDGVVPRDGGPADGSVDTGPPPIVKAAGVCTKDRWCWEHPRPWGHALRAIEPTQAGWIGVGDDGLVVLQDAQGVHGETLQDGHGNPQLRAIWVDPNNSNQIYIAGEGGAVYKRENGAWVSIGDQNLGHIQAITRGKGRLWVVSKKGAFFLLDGAPQWVRRVDLQDDLTDAWADSDGNLTVTSSAWGIMRFDATAQTVYAFNNCPVHLLCSSSNQVAVDGVGPNEIYTVDSKGCYYLLSGAACAVDNSSSGFPVTTLRTTAPGTARALGKGIHCHRTATAGWSCDASSKPSPPAILALGSDNKGTLLVGSDRGELYELEPNGNLKAIGKREDLTSDDLVSAATAAQTLWLLAHDGDSLNRDALGILGTWNRNVTANVIAFKDANYGFVGTADGRLLAGKPPAFPTAIHSSPTGSHHAAIAVDKSGATWVGGGNGKGEPVLFRQEAGKLSFDPIETSKTQLNLVLKGDITALWYDASTDRVYAATNAGSLGWFDNRADIRAVRYVANVVWRGIAGAKGHAVLVGETSGGSLIYERPGPSDNFGEAKRPAALPLYGVATDGAGSFVAVGRQGTILSKTGKAQWIDQESGVLDDLYTVTVQSGEFCAAGERGVVLRRVNP